jgi:methylglutaconyl-CoA hydratase
MPAVELRRHGSTAHLVMNRPEVHNAFDDGLIDALTAALQDAADDDTVRAVVLTGAGASFSAGADLNWMRAMAKASEAANREDSLRLAGLMRRLQYFPKPTVARVNGAAYGGGVGLIACCDIAIGVNGAKFGLTEVKLGLVPAVISPYVIAAIGLRQARRLFLTGELFDATEALRIGLLHQRVEPEALDETVAHTLTTLTKAGPLADGRCQQTSITCPTGLLSGSAHRNFGESVVPSAMTSPLRRSQLVVPMPSSGFSAG